MGTPGSPGGASGKEPACQGSRHKRCRLDPRVGKERPEKEVQPAPVSLPGEPPRTEEPGGLQSMGSQSRTRPSDLARMPGTLRRWGQPCVQASGLHSARGRTDSPAFGELPLVPVDLVDTSVFECPLLSEPGWWELQTNPKSCLTQSCQVGQCRCSILPAARASATPSEGAWEPLLGAPSAWAMSHWGKTLVLP